MTTLVGDIAEQIRGVSYAKGDAEASARAGYVPILRANNITDDGLQFRDLVYVPVERVSSKQTLCPGDVVIAASSGSLDVVGKAAAVENSFNGGFGAFCKVLRPRTAHVDPRYFAHFFRTPAYRRRISQLAAGANINNLKNEHLDDLEIPLPPLAEQRRIAAILDKADAMRRKRKRALELFGTLTQSIFLDMFRDGELVQLSELVDANDRINYGVVQPGEEVDSGVFMVRVSDIRDGRVDHSRLRKVSGEISKQHARSLLKGNEILVSCVGSVGDVALVTEKEAGFNIARAVARVPISDHLLRSYVAEYLRLPVAQRYFEKELRTVSQPTLNIKQISETLVPIPERERMSEFSRRAEMVEGQASALRASAHSSETLFASLQHRAFSGQL